MNSNTGIDRLKYRFLFTFLHNNIVNLIKQHYSLAVQLFYASS